MWGQPYGSPVEAWLAAPLFALLRPDTATLRLAYFLLGLALIPAAYFLARAARSSARPCPRPCSWRAPLPTSCSWPPFRRPMYPSALLLAPALLVLAFRLGARLREGAPARAGPRRLGRAGRPRAVDASHDRDRGRRRRLVALACRGGTPRARYGRPRLALLAASAPWWGRALADPQALEMVSVSGRRAGLGEHLAATLRARARGDRRPARDARAARRRRSPNTSSTRPGPGRGRRRRSSTASPSCSPPAAPGDGFRRRGRRRGAGAPAAAGGGASPSSSFPFRCASSPASIRFLTPAYLPVVALVDLGGGGRRRAPARLDGRARARRRARRDLGAPARRLARRRSRRAALPPRGPRGRRARCSTRTASATPTRRTGRPTG